MLLSPIGLQQFCSPQCVRNGSGAVAIKKNEKKETMTAPLEIELANSGLKYHVISLNTRRLLSWVVPTVNITFYNSFYPFANACLPYEMLYPLPRSKGLDGPHLVACCFRSLWHTSREVFSSEFVVMSRIVHNVLVIVHC